MSVGLSTAGTIVLEGACPIEDAEPLLQLLLANPGASVDWRGCAAAHAAVIQVLLAAKPSLHGPPAGALLARWVSPALAGDLSPDHG